MKNKYYKRKIKFKSYLAFNKFPDIGLFKESKVLSLLIYIAKDIERKPINIRLDKKSKILDIGEFILFKQEVYEDTDIKPDELETILSYLFTSRVIEITNDNDEYILGIWYENDIVDLNLPKKHIHPSYKEEEKEKNNNNSYSSYYSSNSKKVKITKEHKKVFDAYNSLCKVKVPDYQKEYVLSSIDDMFQSNYTPEQIVKFMSWLKEIEGDPEYKWALGWNIYHVKHKLPHFLAGKLKIPSWEDDY